MVLSPISEYTFSDRDRGLGTPVGTPMSLTLLVTGIGCLPISVYLYLQTPRTLYIYSILYYIPIHLITHTVADYTHHSSILYSLRTTQAVENTNIQR